MNKAVEKWLAKRTIGISCRFLTILLVWAALLPTLASSAQTAAEAGHPGHFQLRLFGKVLNPHSSGVSGVAIEVLADGKRVGDTETTGHGQSPDVFLTTTDGSYQTLLWLQKDLVKPETVLEVTASKPGFSRNSIAVPIHDMLQSGTQLLANVDMQI